MTTEMGEGESRLPAHLATRVGRRRYRSATEGGIVPLVLEVRARMDEMPPTSADS